MLLEIIALDNSKIKEIDFYSNYTENKLQALTITAISYFCNGLQSWDLTYSAHYKLASRPGMYDLGPVLAHTLQQHLNDKDLDGTSTILHFVFKNCIESP